jgi:two-component system, sensor histidine kinase and response regulator
MSRARDFRLPCEAHTPARIVKTRYVRCSALDHRRQTCPLVTRHTLHEEKPSFRILLAEDNVVNQVLAVRTLEKRGYSVVVAANGRAAVEALEKENFHLVLMDIQMPGMDGFEATAAIREAEKLTGKHIPIVAMTAHALKGDQDRCMAAGMNGYVSKPICSMDLFAVMEPLLVSRPVVNSVIQSDR